MSKIQKTYSELFTFNSITAGYISKNKGTENVICKAIEVLSKQLVKVFDQYNEKLEVIKLSNCFTDERGVIQWDTTSQGKEYKFTVEKEKAKLKEIAVLKEETVELDSRIPKNIPVELIAKLTEVEKDSFSGVIIPKQVQSIEFED